MNLRKFRTETFDVIVSNITSNVSVHKIFYEYILFRILNFEIVNVNLKSFKNSKHSMYYPLTMKFKK
jgi:hypothetical protein